MKTPNYALKEEYSIVYDIHDVKVLPKGTFVRPVQYEYIPKHVIENPMWRFFNKEREVFCYTRYGFAAIPLSSLREV